MCETSARPLPPGLAPISREEALRLVRHDHGPALEALMDRARAVREAVHGREIALCGITSAKSGACPEDCGFCAQSARHAGAAAPVYPLLPADEIVAQARAAERAGAREFSIVTSGTRIASERELSILEEAIRRIRAETALEPCASLGLVGERELARLRAAGLVHYHHNLECARSFFPRVCTTHAFDAQLETVRTARRLGMKVCTGGILGMGETPEQRVELAEELRDLGVDCVPLNFLNPRPGTPMAHVPPLTAGECLAAVAVFRLMLPAAHLFVMGGRELRLGDRQADAFRAGADGTMVGNYLTSAGGPPDRTVAMIEGAGLALRPPGGGRPWAYRGEAPPEADWNTRAAEAAPAPGLPVIR